MLLPECASMTAGLPKRSRRPATTIPVPRSLVRGLSPIWLWSGRYRIRIEGMNRPRPSLGWNADEIVRRSAHLPDPGNLVGRMEVRCPYGVDKYRYAPNKISNNPTKIKAFLLILCPFRQTGVGFFHSSASITLYCAPTNRTTISSIPDGNRVGLSRASDFRHS